jgi:predicted flap endonuclease-1-like 5' DNA nuclease
MPKIHKVLVEFVRPTSHLKEVFRFEIPLLKAKFPGDTIQIKSLPLIKTEHIGEFDARSAYMFVQQEYGALVQQVYTDLKQFAADFDASIGRDGVGDVTKLAVETDPAEARQKALERLEAIDGIGTGLAPIFYDAGFDTIEAVAAAPLDSLETVQGVGPATAKQISDSAKELVKGMIAEPVEPVTANPFADNG